MFSFRFARVLGSIVLLFVLSACKKAPTEIKDEQIRDVELAYYSKRTLPTSASPVVVYESNGDILALYHIPEDKDNLYFLFQERSNDVQMIIIAGEERIVFSPYYKYVNEPFPVALLSKEDNFYYCFVGDLDLSSGSFNMTSAIPLKAEYATTKASYNYGDDFRRIILRAFYKELKDTQNKADAIDIVTMGKFPSIGRMISHLFTLDYILASLELTEGAGDDLIEEIQGTHKEIYFDTLLGLPVSLATKLISIKEIRPLAGHLLKKLVFSLGRDITTQEAEDRAAEIITPVVSRMTPIPPVLKTVDYKILTGGIPFTISLNIGNVGEDFASVRAKVDFNSNEVANGWHTIMRQGYEITRLSDGNKTTVWTDDFEETNIPLEKATKYSVVAFAHTFDGKKYESPAGIICTKGVLLELSADELVFSQEGGEKTVNVSVGDEETWKVISRQPSWCRVSYSKSVITVSVIKGNTSETCQIEVEAISKYKERKKSIITVSRQAALSWDNTSWHFVPEKWERTQGNGSFSFMDDKSEFDLSIINAQKGSFVLYESVQNEKLNFAMHIDEKGNVVLYDSSKTSFFNVTLEVTHTITISRKGADSSQMDYLYVTKQNGAVQDVFKGLLIGTLKQ